MRWRGLQKHPRVRIDQVEGLRMFFLAINFAFKPWDNKLVRQAANYAVDAPAIVRNIFDGIGYPCNGPVGANVFGADPKLKRYPVQSAEGQGAAGSSRVIPTAAIFSFIIPPDAIPKTKKFARSSRRRWSRAVFASN